MYGQCVFDVLFDPDLKSIDFKFSRVIPGIVLDKTQIQCHTYTCTHTYCTYLDTAVVSMVVIVSAIFKFAIFKCGCFAQTNENDDTHSDTHTQTKYLILNEGMLYIHSSC